jgi:hypothetical protein
MIVATATIECLTQKNVFIYMIEQQNATTHTHHEALVNAACAIINVSTCDLLGMFYIDVSICVTKHHQCAYCVRHK